MEKKTFTSQFQFKKIISTWSPLSENNMVQQLEQLAQWAPPTTWGTHSFWLFSVRVSQFVFSAITIGLTSYAITYFSENVSMDFSLIVSAVSLLYLLLVALITFLAPKSFLTGALFISEIIMTLLWLCAFILSVIQWAPRACYDYRGHYNLGLHYVSWDYVSFCECAKAVIAMTAITCALYCFSFFLLLKNIALPLIREFTAASWWKRLDTHQLSVHKFTGLAAFPFDVYRTHIEAVGASPEISTANSKTEPISEERAASNTAVEPEGTDLTAGGNVALLVANSNTTAS